LIIDSVLQFKPYAGLNPGKIERFKTFQEKPQNRGSKARLWSKNPKTAGNFNFPVMTRGIKKSAPEKRRVSSRPHIVDLPDDPPAG
jgi:hypothetical protein